MAILDEILAANEKYCANPPVDYTNEDHKASKLPKKKIAIVTCMDTRLVNFMEPALGIERGDAKIIKTVGNCVTSVFDNTVRSLMVCIYELGVEEIFIVGHHECGMAKTTSESLIAAMTKRGVSMDAIKMVEKDLKDWADNYCCPDDNVGVTVKALKENPLLPKDVPIHGLMFHPRTGKLDLVINGYE